MPKPMDDTRTMFRPSGGFEHRSVVDESGELKEVVGDHGDEHQRHYRAGEW